MQTKSGTPVSAGAIPCLEGQLLVLLQVVIKRVLFM
jgi:hypothetical protein